MSHNQVKPEDGAQGEPQVRSSAIVVPPPGEYVDIDTEDGTKYPLRVCDMWLSEQEATDMVKELQEAITYLNAKRHNS